MKLLSVNQARSSWWGHINELNPKGIALYPLIITFLVDTYKFKKFPDPRTLPTPAQPGEGIKFEYGEFKVDEGLPIAVALTLFSDSIWANTDVSTDCSDTFLSDMLTRFGNIFQSPDYNEIIKRRTYLSQLYVWTDKSLQTINPKLSKIATFLSQNFEQPKQVFETGGISFWADPARGPITDPFTFERAAAENFAANRYFSRAPLQTNKHIELLDKLETILG